VRHSILARDRFSFTWFAYCPIASCGWPAIACFYFNRGIPCEALLLDDLLNWGGAGTFEPVNSTHEASAKASAHLAKHETNPCHPAGTLPAGSKLNDLVRLRAAIITSYIPGARKKLP
jgi:hypothetical protein